MPRLKRVVKITSVFRSLTAAAGYAHGAHHIVRRLASLRGSSVLTVADVYGFLDGGGMIQFLTENNHVRFAINVDSATRARLKVSSKLLSLARVIGRNANDGSN